MRQCAGRFDLDLSGARSATRPPPPATPPAADRDRSKTGPPGRAAGRAGRAASAMCSTGRSWSSRPFRVRLSRSLRY